MESISIKNHERKEDFYHLNVDIKMSITKESKKYSIQKVFMKDGKLNFINDKPDDPNKYFVIS